MTCGGITTMPRESKKKGSDPLDGAGHLGLIRWWRGSNLFVLDALNLHRTFPLAVALFVVTGAGCNRQTTDAQTAQSATGPTVTVSTVKAERKTLRRSIEQPGQIEAYEETPLIARIPGYVGPLQCDIGMMFKGPKLDEKGNVVKPGEIMARLQVPELVEEHQQKKALVAQAEAEVAQAAANLRAAEAHVETAAARVEETVAGKERVDASYERWNSEYNQLKVLVAKKVVDEQSRDEALNQRDAAAAARKELAAKVVSMQAAYKESQALRDKSRADFSAAQVHVQVAQAEEARLFALLQFADIRAPYDCVVIRRNVHTGHFLQPGTGSGSQPLFVVARTDLLRVAVEIPEIDALLVTEGLPAVIRVQSARDRDFAGKVARLSGSVDARSRTMRAEIDLENKDNFLRPGMYAYVTFHLTLPNRLTLPAATVVVQGNKTYCWQVVNGKAKQTPLRIGLRQEGVVEVVQKLVPSGQSDGSPTWVDMANDEMVIAGNLANLTEGQVVNVKGR
jgi:HlyD family secretion protein